MAVNPLKGLVDLLNEADKLAKEIGEPINEVSSGLQKAESDLTSLENFIRDMNDVVSIAKDVGDLCYALTEIPVVGEFLDGLGTVLREVGNTASKIMTPVNKFKKDVLDEISKVMKKVNDVLSKITDTINFFIKRLPQWANVIQVLYFGWEVVSALMSLLAGTAPAQRLKALMDKFSSIGSEVKKVYHTVSGGLNAVWDVIKSVLKPVYEAIKKFFGWFETIASSAEKVLGIFHDAKNIVDKIEDVIKPIKWALEAVACIFDKIVEPILHWILKELGIEKYVDELKQKLDHALHINDLLNQLKSAFHLDKLTDSGDKLSSQSGNVSQIHQLDAALKDYVANPQQALMDALVSAISGTAVKPGSFPPPPPQPPPLDYGGKSASLQLTVKSHSHPQLIVGFQAKRRIYETVRPLPRPQLLSMINSTRIETFGTVKPLPRPELVGMYKHIEISSFETGPLVAYAHFPAVGLPIGPNLISPNDWSDVDQFVKDIDSICTSLGPVLTLGGQLQQYITKAHAQLVIPGQLHPKLSVLQTETQFLYDVCQVLQLFPIFNLLTPLSAALKDELTKIQSLDTSMDKLVNNASSLSTAIQPIVNAENPTLFATITKLESTLKNWKSQALKYKDQIVQGYDMDAKSGRKHTAQVDALAKTYHQRLGDLQALLSQIKAKAETADHTSHSIATALQTVGGDFDKIDPYVARLEDDITKVAELSSWAGKLDGIFVPLKSMLTPYKCTGDQSNIKGTIYKSFKWLMELGESPTTQQEFKNVFEKLMNEFFPVQSVNNLVNTALQHLQSASSTVSSSSGTYLSTLTSIEKLQVGSQQYQYKNKKTGKTEVIDNHFFSQDQVQQAIKLGQALQKAVGHRF